MNKIDYSFPGGFPNTQEKMDFLQSALAEPLVAAFADVPVNTPVVISGLTTSGSSIAAGFVFYNGEIYKVAGGGAVYSFPSVACVSLSESATSLTYIDGSAHPALRVRAGSIVGGVPGGGPGIALIDYNALVPWQKYLGERGKEAWKSVLISATGLSGNPSGVLYYKKNILSNTLHVRGTFTIQDAQAVASPPNFSQLFVLPVGYRPLSDAARWAMFVRYHGNYFKNASGDARIIQINAELQTGGSVSVGFLRPEAGVASYQVSFNTILPLD